MRKERERFNLFSPIYGPPKFTPKVWGPISPHWGQISVRALHRSVGVRPHSKFGTYENFCGGTLSGSKLRGKIAKIFGVEFGGVPRNLRLRNFQGR